MKRSIIIVTVLALLFVLSSSVLAAPLMGIYINDNYYSTTYLSGLTMAQRLETYQNIQANPETSFVVIQNKYAKFKEYSGIASLIDGADKILPPVVLNLETGLWVNPLTGEEEALSPEFTPDSLLGDGFGLGRLVVNASNVKDFVGAAKYSVTYTVGKSDVEVTTDIVELGKAPSDLVQYIENVNKITINLYEADGVTLIDKMLLEEIKIVK